MMCTSRACNWPLICHQMQLSAPHLSPNVVSLITPEQNAVKRNLQDRCNFWNCQTGTWTGIPLLWLLHKGFCPLNNLIQKLDLIFKMETILVTLKFHYCFASIVATSSRLSWHEGFKPLLLVQHCCSQIDCCCLFLLVCCLIHNAHAGDVVLG